MTNTIEAIGLTDIDTVKDVCKNHQDVFIRENGFKERKKDLES